ncbi:MAG TPA: MGMT family protein [Chthoniobacteraceae bacterium]|jgi:methylated-DNA-protein-cysteine methyltransferase-like protein|nr:MGMT family protein [Chthoniobacteraceae bacterium]
MPKLITSHRRWDEALERDDAFQRAILAIPAGQVSTYGKIAEAAGYPRYHRAVVRFLRGEHSNRLPWHRVVGADGAIKTSGASAKEQRARLRREGVSFRGERVDMSVSLHRPG